MSQQHNIQHHHQQQTQYVHYNPPSSHIQQQQPLQQQQHQQHAITHIAPQDTQHQQIQQQQPQPQQQQRQPSSSDQSGQPQASGSGSGAPLIAKGDWTKDLVQLAKTAELKNQVSEPSLMGISHGLYGSLLSVYKPVGKIYTSMTALCGIKHALTLQLHTAHILSAHASLEQKGKAMEDLREQKNKLESERSRLLNALREINEDRDKVDLMYASLEKECSETRSKIDTLTKTDYAVAKADVDRLRAELGQPPLPSLQSTLDEKTSQYLNERRLNGNENQNQASASLQRGTPTAGVSSSSATPNNNKRSAPSGSVGPADGQVKRPRGRPKGSKNKNKHEHD
ncbi:hypothetical protein D9613_002499 [Agrocybe pediades]|uniref:Uncharacterized protein n=1 Tax=Agrocybe pediades TaxID=84607 RepID=A0A8H4QNW6_9AGAR|nr:hypothetical protein D9613_002499 [Agrocybe pediades]